MDILLQDLRHAWRSLTRAPGFTVTVIIVLALGIGAATAGFTLLNWIVLRPLPGVSDPGTLGLTWFAVEYPGGGAGPNDLTRLQLGTVLRTAPAVATLAGHIGVEHLSASIGSEPPRRVSGDFVAPGYLANLGVRMQLGRDLAPDDDPPGHGRAVAVISDGLWHGMFGARPDAIGSTLRLNGVPFTIIGVTARGFRGIQRLDQTDAWLPGGTFWDVMHYRESARPTDLGYYEYVLRLRNGATFADAERQLSTSVHLLAVDDTNDFNPLVKAIVHPGLGLPAMGRDFLGHQLTLVMVIAALMLLVACANVANLFLLHRARRRGDAVVRLVLGASRHRLVRHFLIESAMLGVAGAAAGVLLALWLLALLRGLPVMGRLSLDGMSTDLRVLAFAAATGIATAVLAGVIPAFIGSRIDFGAELKTAGPTTTRRAPLLRGGLAAVQVAVSLTLVAGAYLFARTLRNFNDVPLGFDPSGVTLFTDEPELLGYSPERAETYRRLLIERVGALPGVTRVALVSIPPFLGSSFSTALRLPGAAADAKPILATADGVTADYFQTMGIPFIGGNRFTAEDDWNDLATGPGKVIVSSALAKELFGTHPAVGRIVITRGRTLEIVGEVGDIHWGSRGGEVEPMLYQPLSAESPYHPMLVVKSHASAGIINAEVTRVAGDLDPTLPIDSWGTLDVKVAASLASQTLLFRLLGIFSVATLALAAIGVYSLVSYGVATRTREFGIRMALGAGAREIVRTATGGAFGIIIAGVAGGVLATVYLTRFVSALLYGVTPLDPTAIGGAAAVLAVAAFAASWLPARRATRIDPMVALRAE
ncbi:MAG: ADOP family duplicated permease [Gemmatimonadales bacterium]